MTAIESAVRWWREQITGRAPKISGDPIIDIFADSVRADAPNIAKVDEFCAMLTAHLNENPDSILSVDYGPEGELGDIAEAAGIDFRCFPIKTVMWVEPDSVTVRCGYRMPEQQVYPVLGAIDEP